MEVLANKSKRKEHADTERSVKGTSSLHCLKPIMDSDGVLRVRGRILQADLPHAVKHPVVLPKKAHLTNLILRHFHQRSGHQGRSRMHAEIRSSSGYWIVNGSSLVGHHISKHARHAPHKNCQVRCVQHFWAVKLGDWAPITFSVRRRDRPFFTKPNGNVV